MTVFRVGYDRMVGRFSWVEYIPESTMIIIVGLVLGGLLEASGTQGSQLEFDPELLFVCTPLSLSLSLCPSLTRRAHTHTHS